MICYILTPACVVEVRNSDILFSYIYRKHVFYCHSSRMSAKYYTSIAEYTRLLHSVACLDCYTAGAFYYLQRVSVVR